MNLKEYFKKSDMDPLEFALKCKISVASVYRYMNGKRPHLKTAKRIASVTKYFVTVDELMGDSKNVKREEIS